MRVPESNKTVDWAAYESLSLDAPTAITWTSTGSDGSGKSAFCLGAPEPIWVAAFDTHGMGRVGKQFKTRADGTPKDIRISRYHFNPRPYKTKEACAAAASVVWEGFIDAYRTALKNARSVLVDREDIAFEILRYANFGDLQAAAKDYGPLNVELTSLVQEANMAGVNLGLLRGVKEKWESKFDVAKGKSVGINTGKLIPDGWKRAADMVDITLFHFWSETDNAYMTRIDKFTEKEHKGTEHADLTFVQMAMAAYPDTDESQWGAN